MNKETLRMQMLAGLITESQYKDALNEAPLDFDKADSIAMGTYKKPETPQDPNMLRKVEIINKFTSRPFDYPDLIELFNNLGPITPKELENLDLEGKFTNVDFDIENGNCIIHSENYESNGVAIWWGGGEWND
jgi:hypothetical protein